jgi:hypothetical protein
MHICQINYNILPENKSIAAGLYSHCGDFRMTISVVAFLLDFFFKEM